jgi:hypothetical protein
MGTVAVWEQNKNAPSGAPSILFNFCNPFCKPYDILLCVGDRVGSSPASGTRKDLSRT